MLEFDEAADTLLAFPDFFSTLLSLPLGVADTNRGLDDLLPLPLRLRPELRPTLLCDFERDLEAALPDLELLRDLEEADLGDLAGLLDFPDPGEEDLDLERDDWLLGLSILLKSFLS